MHGGKFMGAGILDNRKGKMTWLFDCAAVQVRTFITADGSRVD